MPVGILSNLNAVFRYSLPKFTRVQAIEQSIRVHNYPVSRSISNSSFGCYRNRILVGARALSMATSGTKATAADLVVDNLITSCGNVANIVIPSGVYFGDRSSRNCQKASIGFKNRTLINSRNGYASYRGDNCMLRSCNSRTLDGTWFNGFRTSAVQCYSDGPVPTVSLDELTYKEQLDNSAVLNERTLKLQSGSCYLPHPEKEQTGGEDAHFICEGHRAIGVADGVGGWAEVGINAGIYARELMSNSVAAIQCEPKDSIDPAKVLQKAHSVTKEKGSSTACIIILTKQTLHAINLGDSGFIIVRDGCTFFESPVQVHGFNFPYQLENGETGDLPSSGQVFSIPVIPGDVIVAGTDGLFDNVFNNEITKIVVHGLATGLGPKETAQQIASLARERGLDRKRQTPFSTAAQEVGYQYYGGKLDDTTVVVSYVTS